MENNKLESILENIRKNSSLWKLWKKADEQTIRNYETAFGVILPDDYKSFLGQYNGMHNIFLAENAKDLWRKGEYEEANSFINKILSVEEVFEEYDNLSFKKWKVGRESSEFYPYIPFCISGDGEKLVFVNQLLQKEPAIYYAYHDEPASAWVAVAKNFTEFLHFFVASKGQLPTKEIAGNFCAENFLQKFDLTSLKKNFEDPVEIIKRKSAYLELFPNDDLSLVIRANAYTDLKEYRKAMIDYNRALELQPKSAFAYNCRGSMLFKIKNFRQALTDFDAASKLKPDDPYYLSKRAEAFYELNAMDKALADCNKAIELDDKFLLAYMTRFKIYLYLGEGSKAESDNEKINELMSEE